MPYPKIPLEPDSCYHVFNHAVGNDDFFSCTDNYYYFIRKVKQWILPVADFYAWCLMPNHFHFVVRIRSESQLELVLSKKLEPRLKKADPDDSQAKRNILINLVNEQFSHCFNGYAQAYNKMYRRMGSLFKGSFQRKKISTSDYLKRVICYVHNNPVHHGFEQQLYDWQFHSFQELTGAITLMTLKPEVIELFGGLPGVMEAHKVNFGDEILLDSHHLNYLTED